MASRDGKRVMHDLKKTKSRSSRRTLPLIGVVKEALLKHKELHEEYKRVLKAITREQKDISVPIY